MPRIYKANPVPSDDKVAVGPESNKAEDPILETKTHPKLHSAKESEKDKKETS